MKQPPDQACLIGTATRANIPVWGFMMVILGPSIVILYFIAKLIGSCC